MTMALGSESIPVAGLLAVTPTPSFCYRIFMRDSEGVLWAPIITAVGATQATERARDIFPRREVMGFEAMHAAFWHPGPEGAPSPRPFRERERDAVGRFVPKRFDDAFEEIRHE